ncbi:MAG: MarR family winged helix-turn-helix transcriptional regulator [Actinomycetota bacterium]|nr:MarR family winged helix-turn-helix transcriptional regulator [Actinomycetota bacterium]
MPDPAPAADACPFVAGDVGLASWTDVEADAWIGLLESHKRLTRALDAELEGRHGLTLSSVELLGRLAAAPGHQLRLSRLAAEAGLSLSRVSRIVDVLEARGVVRRQTCPSDARAVEAHLTGAGLALARDAQATHVASVRERFLDRLGPGETEALASVFRRFSPNGAGACNATAADAASETAPSS